jgi:hypothetical protein
MLMMVLGVVAPRAAVLQAQVAPAPATASAPVVRGYLVGQVVDRETGRGVPNVSILVDGTLYRTRTDLDGRYRLPTPVGVYTVRTQRLGSTAAQQANVRISATASTTVNFAIGSAAVQLQSVAVSAGPTRASSEDALLAMQKASPRVSDGISAEAISRAPGADAGEAVARVTGVSIVDNKFAVVRGLAERYSNTLLNGVELPSPEPLKKIVPLDIFPSSLLESVIVSKTATPDRPGDFAGGSVEVSTKEFPNDKVREFSVSTGYNSQATFRNYAQPSVRGLDWIGVDQGDRRSVARPLPAVGAARSVNEAWAETLRNEWTPAASRIVPDLNATMNLGGRVGGESAPFGYAISGSFARQTDATPNRLVQLAFTPIAEQADAALRSREVTRAVDAGLITNFAWRASDQHKLGWKNLGTRNVEERLSQAPGFDRTGSQETVERLIYQSRYITRTLMQSQLSGDHYFPALRDSRLEWKATLAGSNRDEPENRSLIYTAQGGTGALGLDRDNPSFFWFRFLDDRVRTAQADWSVSRLPLLRGGSYLKTGVLYRARRRAYDGSVFGLQPAAGRSPVSPEFTLPPEQIFSPEALGSIVDLERLGIRAIPYRSDDNVTSAYLMLDAPLLARLRLVGGARNEAWSVRLENGERGDSTALAIVERSNTDLLLSANLTWTLTTQQNLRLALYQTVARPDPRELALDYYIPVAGDCGNVGNPDVRRSRILNADLRWERYPRAGELLSLSVFRKQFTDPIMEEVSFEGSALCTVQFTNYPNASVNGVELEVRRGLGFLPGPLKGLVAGLNVTAVRSRAEDRQIQSDSITLTRTFRLLGQSDLLVNGSLAYRSSDGRRDATVLVNWFSDRILRYGIATLGSTGFNAFPNVIEQGRISLDAKVRQRIGRATASLSLRNLTDNEVIYSLDGPSRLLTGYLRPGIGVTLGVGYAFK